LIASWPPTVSVVIPARDVEDWIGPTIRSVMKQEPAPHEIIVIDDGSADRTAAIARGFGDQVRVVSQPNAGLSAARNAGAERASGEVLLFLDADDVLLPGSVEGSLSIWSRAAPTAMVCIPNHIRSSPDGRSLAWPTAPEVRLLGRRDLASLLLKNFLLANAFVTRDVWRRFPFDEDLLAVEDLDFYARVLIADIPIVVLGQPGVVMAERRSGSMTSRTRWMREQRRVAFSKLSSAQGLTRKERRVLLWQRTRTGVGSRLPQRERGKDISLP
jgi:glycosyltransferase involved in cell wall biosynthesis